MREYLIFEVHYCYRHGGVLPCPLPSFLSVVLLMFLSKVVLGQCAHTHMQETHPHLTLTNCVYPPLACHEEPQQPSPLLAMWLNYFAQKGHTKNIHVEGGKEMKKQAWPWNWCSSSDFNRVKAVVCLRDGEIKWGDGRGFINDSSSCQYWPTFCVFVCVQEIWVVALSCHSHSGGGDGDDDDSGGVREKEQRAAGCGTCAHQ